MLSWVKSKDNFDILKISVILVFIIGLTTAIFFIVIQKESYSAIYIIPGSIIHNSDDNTVFYTYGVKSSETGETDYSLDIYADKTLIKSRNFSLKPKEIFEERDKIALSDAKNPVKISLTLKTNSATEEIHFWVR
jgi:hypothetical protein